MFCISPHHSDDLDKEDEDSDDSFINSKNDLGLSISNCSSL